MAEQPIDAEVEEIIDGDNLPAVREANALITRGELTVDELVGQSEKIKQAMAAVMREGTHYGTIPGTNKPTLYKPGAEVLNVLLRLAPSYQSEKVFHPDGHLTVSTKCTLTHIPTGFVIAEGEGMCSTMEAKYAYRTGGRACPECGQPAIIKGKAEYGGGWLCFARKGGCGAKWSDSDSQAQEFEKADTGRAPNPDLADSYNTVLKMSDKRALIAAVLNGTAASDVFTQDLEDSGPAPPPAARSFDPETDLLPGAISGKDAKARIAEMLSHLNPSVDWQATIRNAVSAKYGSTDDWRELPDQADFWRRLSNAAEWIRGRGGDSDFPPIDFDLIQKGFAFAFSGVAVTVVAEKEEDLPDDLPPFGEGEDE